jgi:Ca2+/Na+ antiporter
MEWCDVKNPEKKDMWLQCFGTSMAWLALFSYLMVTAADGLHTSFGIPMDLLGITVCAVGTSFPNFWASILMAKQGRGSMAVANALGSNVQNVFLALALPWTVKCFLSGPLAVAANGIFAGVLWMGGTLVLMFSMALIRGFKLSPTDGYILIALYFVYLAFAILG